MQTDWWCSFLHFEQNTLSLLLQACLWWPQLRQRKHRLADFNFSIRSFTSVTALQSWAQWLLLSQNTQNGSTDLLLFRDVDPDLEQTCSVTAVGVKLDAGDVSPRIFCDIRSPSTSSHKNSINLMSPSEWPSHFTWMIQCRQISGNAQRIFRTNTLPYAFTSSPSARRAWIRQLHSMYVVFSASADANQIGVTYSK